MYIFGSNWLILKSTIQNCKAAAFVSINANQVRYPWIIDSWHFHNRWVITTYRVWGSPVLLACIDSTMLYWRVPTSVEAPTNTYRAAGLPTNLMEYICIANWETVTRRVIIEIAVATKQLLYPSDAIWRHRSESTFVHILTCCLTAPSHYPNQCWLSLSRVL